MSAKNEEITDERMMYRIPCQVLVPPGTLVPEGTTVKELLDIIMSWEKKQEIEIEFKPRMRIATLKSVRFGRLIYSNVCFRKDAVFGLTVARHLFWRFWWVRK